jgi:hypothetical protein
VAIGVVLVETGQIQLLDALRLAWLPSLLIGTYSNLVDVNRTLTLSSIVPSAYSGYSGLHALPGWSAAVLLGDIAVSNATPRLWQHDGGDVSEWVNGIYVVDSSNTTLIWAESFVQSILMATSSDAVEYTPQFAVGSRYG